MGDQSGPKLFDLMIKKEKQWNCGGNEEKIHGLELRLGLPCEEDWSNSSSYLKQKGSGGVGNGNGKGVFGCGTSSCSPGYKPHVGQQHQYQTGLHNGRSLAVMVTKDSSQSQPCCARVGDLQTAEKKAFSAPNNTAVPNTSQKRAAPTPVVGWPPIRSFRKNLASSSSAKAGSDQQNVIQSKAVNEKPTPETSHKGLFVKINMDGVPIGRKVDLNACNCYENLSSSVDQLFRGLLAAQNDPSCGGIDTKQEEQKPITGLLDGTGEYTLVYEDNEGDRMLVGDVPWHMFVSTVKRLRVLKSSDLPSLSRGGSKQGKVMTDNASK